MAPMDQNKSVRVIKVVMSWSDMWNWALRFFILKETQKKLMALAVHANHLYYWIRSAFETWALLEMCRLYPEKKCAHWIKMISWIHFHRGLPSLCQHWGFRLDMKYGTTIIENPGRGQKTSEFIHLVRVYTHKSRKCTGRSSFTSFFIQKTLDPLCQLIALRTYLRTLSLISTPFLLSYVAQ